MILQHQQGHDAKFASLIGVDATVIEQQHVLGNQSNGARRSTPAELHEMTFKCGAASFQPP